MAKFSPTMHQPDQLSLWDILGEPPAIMRRPERSRSLHDPIAKMAAAEHAAFLKATVTQSRAVSKPKAGMTADAVVRAYFASVITPPSPLAMARRKRKRERAEQAAALINAAKAETECVSRGDKRWTSGSGGRLTLHELDVDRHGLQPLGLALRVAADEGACPTSAPVGQIEGLHERRMGGSS